MFGREFVVCLEILLYICRRFCCMFVSDVMCCCFSSSEQHRQSSRICWTLSDTTHTLHSRRHAVLRCKVRKQFTRKGVGE